MKKAIPIILIYLIIGYFCARQQLRHDESDFQSNGCLLFGAVGMTVVWPIWYPMFLIFSTDNQPIQYVCGQILKIYK